MHRVLLFLFYLALLLAIIPLIGFLAFGGIKGAIAYTKEYGRGMLVIFAMALVLGLILL